MNTNLYRKAAKAARRNGRSAAVSLILGSFASFADAGPRCADIGASQNCRHYAVSLVQLIANPDQFEGKRVIVSGFLSLEFEGRALYLHQDDFRVGNTSSAVALEWPANGSSSIASMDCPSERYVQLEGEFSGKNTGHMGLYAGTLRRIERCAQRSMRSLQ